MSDRDDGMQPDPSRARGALDGNEIVVTATRSPSKLVDVPASVSVLDQADLRRTGFFVGGDEFRTVPGVSFRRGEGDNDDFLSVSFRGITGNHGNDTFLSLIDGIPMLTPNEEVQLSQVPYGAVDRIEVVRGPVSALYGRGGIAGAVNYLTRTPTETGLTAEVSAGSWDYYRGNLTGSYAGDGLKGLLSLDYEESDGWRDNNARHNLNIFGKAIIDLGPRSTLSLWVNHLDKRAQLGSSIPTRPDGSLVDVTGGRRSYYGLPDAHRDQNTWLVAGRLRNEFSDALSLETTVSWRRERVFQYMNFNDAGNIDLANDQQSAIYFTSPNTARTLYGESVLRWATDRNTLTAGISYENTRYHDREIWTGYYGFDFTTFNFYFYANPINYRTGQLIPNFIVPYVSDLRLDARSTQDSFGGFIQDEFRVTDRLTVTLGGRYDHFKRNVNFAPTDISATAARAEGSAGKFTPKASIAYRFDPGQLYFTYGQGFSSNFGPVWQWDPASYTRRTKPTTIDSYELGFKGAALDDRLSYALAGFYLDQKNRLIYYTSVVGQPQVATSGPPYRSYGLEASAAIAITPTTRLSANYSYVHAKYRASAEYDALRAVDPALEDLAGRQPVGVPHHNLSARLDQRLWGDRVDLSAVFEHHGNYWIDTPNTHRGGAFSLVNLGVTVRPGLGGLEIEGSVTNALNKKYNYLYGNGSAIAYAVPGLPRQARITARVRL